MNGSDPAFHATLFENGQPIPMGLSKREYFSAMAMQGILVGTFGERPHAKPTPDKVAVQALSYADALIAELSK